MIHLTLAQAAAILNADYGNENRLDFRGLSIDSRTLQAKNLFFAIKGEHCDGHQFIEQAKQQGAAAAIVQYQQNIDLPQIIVKDTIQALGKLAQAWRDSFNLSMIGLTGSSGKTTVKNMLAAIFNSEFTAKAVLATEGNYNNHLGLPLMLAKINPEHRFAILEMGMNHFDEIDYLTCLTKPSIALINNVGSVHLAGVGHTLEGAAQAKGEIFSGLTTQGIAIINADDEFADYWRKLAANKKIINFAIDTVAEVKGQLTAKGLVIHYQNQSQLIELKLMGRHNQMNALAASAVALASGIKLEVIARALITVEPHKRRLEIKKGLNNSTIIDDGYNANPISVKAALDTFANQTNNTILILGDMRELGDDTIRLHQEIGNYARQIGYQHLFTLGELMQYAAKSFGTGAQHFNTHEDLIKAVQPYLKKGINLLVKGSLTMNMLKIVQAVAISKKIVD